MNPMVQVLWTESARKKRWIDAGLEVPLVTSQADSFDGQVGKGQQNPHPFAWCFIIVCPQPLEKEAQYLSWYVKDEKSVCSSTKN